MRALEERGIGRPSTYASIMGTILDRGYVYKKGTALVPTFRRLLVTQLLERHFDSSSTNDFTARLEDDLDRIAAGDEVRVAWLRRSTSATARGSSCPRDRSPAGIDARDVNSIAITRLPTSLCASGATVRTSSGASNGRASPTTSRPTSSLRNAPRSCWRNPLALSASLGVPGEQVERCPRRTAATGRTFTEALVEGEDGKPRTASLFSSMSLDTITLEDAVRLLTLPRTLDGTNGEEIVVANGRYARSSSEEPRRARWSPKSNSSHSRSRSRGTPRSAEQRRGRGAPKAPLKEVGPDPASGKPIVVKDGRFGPYVTDGETNASLRRGETPEGITLERAVELLAERRAKSA